MLRSAKELTGYTIQATDGKIGEVHDFLFDDESWTIRYLVADTGKWLSGRKVLLSPVALDSPDWQKRIFPVTVSMEQVEKSPPIEEDKPVSRQQELTLHTYYTWSPYWTPYAASGGTPAPVPAPSTKPETDELGDTHLRSIKEVKGYHIEASDGEVGHVEDFLLDEEGWYIRYMAVNTRNWLPGKHVIISPKWAKDVSWTARTIAVDVEREKVKDAPEFNPNVPVTREYERLLFDFYGRPKYWF